MIPLENIQQKPEDASCWIFDIMRKFKNSVCVYFFNLFKTSLLSIFLIELGIGRKSRAVEKVLEGFDLIQMDYLLTVQRLFCCVCVHCFKDMVASVLFSTI